MNIAIVSISIATFLYLLCSFDNWRQGDYPHMLTWFAYALANVGLLWYEYNKYIQGQS